MEKISKGDRMTISNCPQVSPDIVFVVDRVEEESIGIHLESPLSKAQFKEFSHKKAL